MTTLLLSLVLAAEVLSPPIPVQAASGAAVQVPAEPGTIDVAIANQSVFAVWADQRRAQGLLTATQVTAPVADLWVRALDGGLAPRLVCPTQSTVHSTRLFATPLGRVGLAWRRGPAGDVALTVFDPGLQFENGPCGVGIATGSLGRPALVAADETFRLAWETDGGISTRLEPSGAMVPPRRMFDGCTQPVLAETPDGSYTAALCDGGIGLMNRGVVEPVTINPTTAFTLVPELDGPVLARVDTMGQLWLHLGPVVPGSSSQASVVGRQPLAANTNQSPLVAFESSANTVLVNGVNSRMVAGLPAGLAASGAEAFIATQQPTGAVRGSEVKVMAGGLSLSVPESISTARVLQRRPSVAWWADAQRWLVTWEEASGPGTWVPRGAVVQASGGSRPVALPSTLAWPRVLRELDGGVRLYGQEALQTSVFGLLADGGFSAAGTIPFVVRGGVTGATHTYWWSDPVGQLRRESVDGLTGLTTSIVDGFEVSCAAWTAGSDGGTFLVTRDSAGGSALARFVDDASPPSTQQLLSQAERGCVSARPGSSQVALLEQSMGVLRLTRSSLTGELTSEFAADAGAFGLQLAPTATGWVVAYNSDAGVFAVSVDDVLGAQPRYYRLDTAGVAHGNPSVAAAPTGAVAVTWASLIGDSVEVRVRVLEPVAIDGGQDAGASSVDAGVPVDAGLGPDGGVEDGGVTTRDAGSNDGGVVDAGESGDAGVSTFVAVCGCGATDDASLLVVLVLVLAAGGMRRRG